ncbi:MAG: EAL domain-containing protein [Lachnospiraceae bacterium]
MHYDYDFEIAALVLMFFIMLHYFMKTTIVTKQRKAFSILLILAFSESTIDIISILLLEQPGGGLLDYILNATYLIVFSMVPMVYYIYISITTQSDGRMKLWEKCFSVVPITIVFLAVVTTPWTNWIFYFDENWNYHHGPLFNIVYVAGAAYLSVCLFIACSRKKTLTKGQRVAVYAFTVGNLITVLIQNMLSEHLIISMSVAVAILMIYLSLENPNDFQDKQLGIYNREAFIQAAGYCIEQKREFEVLAVQIDGYSVVNEMLGVKNGDFLLKEIAEFLQQTVGKGMVCHIEGLRFAILSIGEEQDLTKSARTIAERFQVPFLIQHMEILLSAVMCHLEYPQNVKKIEDIMDIIEYTLKDPKPADEDGISYMPDDALKQKRRETKIIHCMKQALQNDSLRVYYQPIYSVKKKRYTSAEALVRLWDETMGFISPEEFIPLAEKNGLILKIGERVFREVSRFISENQIWKYGIEYIEVNLSVVQCMQEKMFEKLLSVMREYRVKPSMINLEITETSAVVSKKILLQNMQKLIEQGCSFALDDYGTGYSNTTTLMECPFHIIKLDKSMVWTAMEDERALIALKHTTAMIKEMDMNIVAEGIETKEQAQLLASFGCDFFQGFYYSKPVSAKSFLAILRQSYYQAAEQ